MKMTFTILVEVSVDERSGPNLIDAARQHYRDTKAAGLTLNGETFQRRGASPEEEIQTALDALGELAVRPDLLQAAGVQINWSSATTARVGDPGFPDADPAGRRRRGSSTLPGCAGRARSRTLFISVA